MRWRLIYRRQSPLVQLHAWAEEESSLKAKERVAVESAAKLEFALMDFALMVFPSHSRFEDSFLDGIVILEKLFGQNTSPFYRVIQHPGIAKSLMFASNINLLQMFQCNLFHLTKLCSVVEFKALSIYQA